MTGNAVTDHDRARLWAEYEAERRQLTQRYEDIRSDLESCKERLASVDKELRATLGSQRPQRVFDLGNGTLVMATATKGVELVTVEKADG